MLRWRSHLNRLTSSFRSFTNLVFRPLTRSRQCLQLEFLRFFLISSTTSSSERPNCILIASNGVRSSQAIAITRSISSSFSIFLKPITFLNVIHSMRGVKKSDLPTKICTTCGRPFAWRKKWERVWEEVLYCSDACRKNKKMTERSTLAGAKLAGTTMN